MLQHSKVHFLIFSHSSTKSNVYAKSYSAKTETKITRDKKCSNLFSLYFSVIYVEYFITAFHSTESCTIDSTAVLTHEWIAQAIYFIYSFGIPLLRSSLFAQPSSCSALWTPLLGTQRSFAPWMLLPALFKALHMTKAALSSSCYHWELSAWYNSIKYTCRIFLQWKHKTVFYWVIQF